MLRKHSSTFCVPKHIGKFSYSQLKADRIVRPYYLNLIFQHIFGNSIFSDKRLKYHDIQMTNSLKFNIKILAKMDKDISAFL